MSAATMSSNIVNQPQYDAVEAPGYKNDDKKPTLSKDELASQLLNASKLNDQATISIKNGQFGQAIETSKLAIASLDDSRFDPKSDDFKKMLVVKNATFNNLSTCYINLQDYPEAFVYAEKVVLTDPDNAKALYSMALCAENKKGYQAAFDKLKGVKEIYTRQGLSIPEEVNVAYARVEAKCIPNRINEIMTEEYPPVKTAVASGHKHSHSHKKSHPFQKMVLLLPSSLLAFMIIRYVLKDNMQTSRSLGGLMMLTLSIFGALSSNRTITRAFFVLTAAFLGGVLYKYK